MAKKPKKLHPNSPAVRNKQWATEVFKNARHPSAWLSVARHLRSSSQLLHEHELSIWNRLKAELDRTRSTEEDIDELRFPLARFEVSFMLISFALENLLKALAIAKKCVVFSDDVLPDKLKTHDLRVLQDLAHTNAKLSVHGLDLLTYMAEFRGRYPIPTSSDKFWQMNDDGTPKSIGFGIPESYKGFIAYFDSLEEELRSVGS